LAYLLDPKSSTTLATNAALFGFCGLLAAMSRPVYVHYYAVAFALPALSLVRLAFAGSSSGLASIANTRRILAVIVVAQGCVSSAFLAYVHQVQRIDGDYGTAFGSQAHALTSKEN